MQDTSIFITQKICSMKTWLLFISIGFSLLVSSCSTTEEIWISQDGSLRREWKIDMSAIMPFMKMAEESQDSTDMTLEEPAGAVEEENEGDIDKMFSGLMKRDNVDTLIAFRPLLMEAMQKEGLTEDQMWQALAESDDDEISPEEKKSLQGLVQTLLNSQLRLKMSEAENIYFFSLIQEFEDADALNVGQDVLSTLSSLGGRGAEGDPTQDAMMKMMAGQNPTYSLKKKEFRITRPPADPNLLSEEDQESMQMMQMFMGAMEYEYVIHFPKKVKKVNLKEAEIIDGNTVRIKVPMLNMDEKSEAFELVVKY